MNRFPLILLSFLMMFTSCRKDREPNSTTPDSEGSDVPIVLSTSTGVTRAEAENQPLESFHEQFGIWSIKFKSGAEPEVVMQHGDGNAYLVETAGKTADNKTIWQYDGLTVNSFTQFLKYWDESASRYYFSGYAPFYIKDEHGNNVIAPVGVDLNSGIVRIDDIKGHLDFGTQAIDWLVCRHLRMRVGSNIVDVDAFADPECNNPKALNGMTEKVPLVFHHLLSQVIFRIVNSEDEVVDHVDCNVRVVQIPEGGSVIPDYFVTRADYAGTWTLDTSSGSLRSEIASMSDSTVGYSKPTEFSNTVEIPQNIGSRYFEVTITINNPLDPDDSQTLVQAFEVPEDWESGKKYIYLIKFSFQIQDIILTSVTVDYWEDGGKIDETQTNW